MREFLSRLRLSHRSDHVKWRYRFLILTVLEREYGISSLTGDNHMRNHNSMVSQTFVTHISWLWLLQQIFMNIWCVIFALQHTEGGNARNIRGWGVVCFPDLTRKLWRLQTGSKQMIIMHNTHCGCDDLFDYTEVRDQRSGKHSISEVAIGLWS